MDEIGNVREMGIGLLSLSRKFNEKLNSIEKQSKQFIRKLQKPSRFGIFNLEISTEKTFIRSKIGT